MYIFVVAVFPLLPHCSFWTTWPCLKLNQRLHLFAMYDVVEHKQLLGIQHGPQHNSTFILYGGEERNTSPNSRSWCILFSLLFFPFSHSITLPVRAKYGTLLVGMSDNVTLNHQPSQNSGWLKKKRQREWKGTKRTPRKKSCRRRNFFFLGEVTNNKLKRSGFVIDSMFND